MQVIEYRVTYAEGETEVVRVSARDVNSGFGKALRVALEPLGSGRVRELHSIAFSMVKS